jgi:uncharacterized membrane protein YjgN (DUF898 family)
MLDLQRMTDAPSELVPESSSPMAGAPEPSSLSPSTALPDEATPPPIQPPELPPPLSLPASVGLQFTGQAQEYFRIWIVNTLLTILTCGVFAAWAKVRKRRYLRGNTTLDGHAFHYTANPWRILVGNIIVASLFLAYSFFGSVYPVARVTAFVIAIFILPWVVVRSLSFNAHQTLYRGMRLRFRASLTEASLVYLFCPLLIVLTVGWYYPAWLRRKQAFTVKNHRYGDAFFRFTGRNGPFYRAVIFGGLIVFAGAALLGGSVTLYTLYHDGVPPDQSIILALTVILYGSAFFTGRHYTFPRVFNHSWNHTHLDDHRFVANMSAGKWMGMQWVNLLAIVGTCGLALPWATIRSTRYALSSLSIELTNPEGLAQIQSMGNIKGSAVGDSAAEFAGMDFGL